MSTDSHVGLRPPRNDIAVCNFFSNLSIGVDIFAPMLSDCIKDRQLLAECQKLTVSFFDIQFDKFQLFNSVDPGTAVIIFLIRIAPLSNLNWSVIEFVQ